MAKISFVVILAAFAVISQGAPTHHTEFAQAAAAGNWAEIQRLWSESLKYFNFQPGDIKSLKPPQGGKLYAESEYTFHSASNIHGYTTEQSGGHKVINDNGQVTEYDFKPKFSG